MQHSCFEIYRRYRVATKVSHNFSTSPTGDVVLSDGPTYRLIRQNMGPNLRIRYSHHFMQVFAVILFTQKMFWCCHYRVQEVLNPDNAKRIDESVETQGFDFLPPPVQCPNHVSVLQSSRHNIIFSFLAKIIKLRFFFW